MRLILRALLSNAVVVALLVPAGLADAYPQSLAHGARSAATVSSRIDVYLAGLAKTAQFSGTVLVARGGTTLLSKGYGMADRAHRVPDTPHTPYQVLGVQGSIAFLGALWLEQHAQLRDQAQICTFLPQCPGAWHPITVHMVLAGTSGIPGFDTSTPGQTTAQSLRTVQAEPLDHTPGVQVDYQNGGALVLGLIIERVSGQPYGTFIRRVALAPAGMSHSGWLTPTTAPRSLAQSYSGTTYNGTAISETSSFFPVFATAADVYAYDNALFAGKLVSRQSLSKLFTPRVSDPNAPPGFVQARLGYLWSSALVARHRAIYTPVRSDRYISANLRFAQDGVTLVVLGNDDQNDVGGIALHLATLVFGSHA